MKNDKGAALAYVIMTMLLVFALCALITTVAITQSTYTDSKLKSSQKTLICKQIGDLFCDTNGDYLHNGSANADRSPFAAALKAAQFTITDDGSFWTANNGEHTFTLVLYTDGGTKTLKISDSSEIVLTVCINTEGENEILVFGKGA